jgi:hypothetical protein
MTTFPRISTTALAQHKNAPRIWLEGKYLQDAGFVPGCHIQVEFATNKIVITLAPNGPRIVSSKKHRQVPVVDLNSSAIQTTFGNTVSKLQVIVSPNRIVLTPAHSSALRASRCKNGTEGQLLFRRRPTHSGRQASRLHARVCNRSRSRVRGNIRTEPP